MRAKPLTKEQFLEEVRFKTWATVEAIVEEDDFYYGSGDERDVLGELFTQVDEDGSVAGAGATLSTLSCYGENLRPSVEVAESQEEQLYQAYLRHCERQASEESVA